MPRRPPDDEATFARILARAQGQALREHCASALAAEAADACHSLKLASDALRALHELQSAERHLRALNQICSSSATVPNDRTLSYEEIAAVSARISAVLAKVVQRTGQETRAELDSDSQVKITEQAGAEPKPAANDCERNAVTSAQEPTFTLDGTSPSTLQPLPSRKRKLSAVSEGPPSESTTAPSEPVIKSFPKPDLEAAIAAIESRRSAVDFDPNEAPVEIPADESDEESEASSPTKLTCLGAAKRLESGSMEIQSIRYPALVDQLHQYLQTHTTLSEAEDSDISQAVEIAIQIGLKLPLLPTIRSALATLLVATELLQTALGQFPAALSQSVGKLSIYFLNTTTAEADQEPGNTDIHPSTLDIKVAT